MAIYSDRLGPFICCAVMHYALSRMEHMSFCAYGDWYGGLAKDFVGELPPRDASSVFGLDATKHSPL